MLGLGKRYHVTVTAQVLVRPVTDPRGEFRVNDSLTLTKTYLSGSKILGKGAAITEAKRRIEKDFYAKVASKKDLDAGKNSYRWKLVTSVGEINVDTKADAADRKLVNYVNQIPPHKRTAADWEIAAGELNETDTNYSSTKSPSQWRQFEADLGGPIVADTTRRPDVIEAM